MFEGDGCRSDSRFRDLIARHTPAGLADIHFHDALVASRQRAMDDGAVLLDDLHFGANRQRLDVRGARATREDDNR